MTEQLEGVVMYEIELFVTPPSEELVCAICHCVFNDPIESPCQHVFCRSCIEAWLETSNDCPNCRNTLSHQCMHPVLPLVKNLIEKLLMRCENLPVGCKQEMVLGRYKAHKKVCEYELVSCPNGACNTAKRRKDMDSHKSKCAYERMVCNNEGCNITKLRKDLERHTDTECRYRLVRCTKDCEQRVPYHVITTHSCIEQLQEKLQGLLNSCKEASVEIAPRTLRSRVAGGWCLSSNDVKERSPVEAQPNGRNVAAGTSRSNGQIQDHNSSRSPNEDFEVLSRITRTQEPVLALQQFSRREPILISKNGQVLISEGPTGKSWIDYDSNFLLRDMADNLLAEILNNTEWEAGECNFKGERFMIPRLFAWYGPIEYKFSGLTIQPIGGQTGRQSWPPFIKDIHDRLEEKLNCKFNSVILNLYRDNNDSVGWHSDSKGLIDVHPTIASVSLGATRLFELRKDPAEGEWHDSTEQVKVNLAHGSLLVMSGCVQDDWKHRVGKQQPECDERVNLTFRNVFRKNNN